MSETTADPARPMTDDTDTWRAYWQAQGMPWRTEPEIPTERQAYLAERRAITPDIEQGVYPFKGVESKLTRADIEWLLVTHESQGIVGPVDWEQEKVKPHKERREGLELRGADLRSLQLYELPLARLRAAFASEEYDGATKEQAREAAANLTGANLGGATLTDANLTDAPLTGTYLTQAPLTGANLTQANLERADLTQALLPNADLRLAFLNSATTLKAVMLARNGTLVAKVADVRWGGVNLAVIDWSPIIAAGLGDEQAAWEWKPTAFGPGASYQRLSRKERAEARARWREGQAAHRLDTFQAAVRANRQVATALRDQGMNEQADQFAYRAQVVQRRVYRLQGQYGRAVFSWFLDAIAGHGYKPQRSLWTYIGVLLSFAALFFLAGNGWLTFGLAPSQYQGIPWYEALILSVSSFHGRGFFQPLQTLGDPVAIIASVEAVFGLFIEVAFIATFTQRFFGK